MSSDHVKRGARTRGGAIRERQQAVACVEREARTRGEQGEWSMRQPERNAGTPHRRTTTAVCGPRQQQHTRALCVSCVCIYIYAFVVRVSLCSSAPRAICDGFMTILPCAIAQRFGLKSTSHYTHNLLHTATFTPSLRNTSPTSIPCPTTLHVPSGADRTAARSGPVAHATGRRTASVLAGPARTCRHETELS